MEIRYWSVPSSWRFGNEIRRFRCKKNELSRLLAACFFARDSDLPAGRDDHDALGCDMVAQAIVGRIVTDPGMGWNHAAFHDDGVAKAGALADSGAGLQNAVFDNSAGFDQHIAGND
jgi:hypothetical protein